MRVLLTATVAVILGAMPGAAAVLCADDFESGATQAWSATMP